MKKLISFIRQESGGMAILFALVLPFILSFCALAFDSARLMTKKARLADALNEATLAIATTSSSAPTDAEKRELETLLTRYIEAYLPNDELVASNIDITYVTDEETASAAPVFNITAKIDVNTLLPMANFPSFEPMLTLANHGKVRKGGQSGKPADYVFVLDFSNSMDLESAQPGMTRLELLKKVVRDITTKSLAAHPETTFALVPFDTAVMVKYPHKKNELDGYINGCSVLMVPKKAWDPNLNMEVGHDIDYVFWANKISALRNLPAPATNATTLTYTLEEVNKLIDESRYSYFRSTVIPSLTLQAGKTVTWNDLVTMGWCVKNDPEEFPYRAEYSCEKDPSDSIFTPENQAKIKNEMERARRVAFTYSYYVVNSLSDPAVADIEATLDGMFDEANIITFPLTYWNTDQYYSAMCKGSGVPPSPDYGNQLAYVVPATYLIEPTNDLSVLEQFQTMQAKGSTESSSGILRAVPEMLKGSNPRTVMIVISDGDDNYPTTVDSLHRNRPAGDRVCDRIREGVKARKPGTDEVDIYFISVVDDNSGATRTKYWADYCTGEANAVIATDYGELMRKLTEFMNQYEETGYFTN